MVIRFAMSTQWSWRKPALEEFRRIKKTQCTAGFKMHFYVVSGSEMLLMQAVTAKVRAFASSCLSRAMVLGCEIGMSAEGVCV